MSDHLEAFLRSAEAAVVARNQARERREDSDEEARQRLVPLLERVEKFMDASARAADQLGVVRVSDAMPSGPGLSKLMTVATKNGPSVATCVTLTQSSPAKCAASVEVDGSVGSGGSKQFNLPADSDLVDAWLREAMGNAFNAMLARLT